MSRAFGALGEAGLLGSLAAALVLRLMRHRARSQGNGRLNSDLSPGFRSSRARKAESSSPSCVAQHLGYKNGNPT